jgi:hypothetical protein
MGFRAMSMKIKSARTPFFVGGAALIVLLALAALPFAAGQMASSANQGPSSSSSSASTSTETVYAPPPSGQLTCGLQSSQGNGTVATSPAGSAITVTVGEPSWDEACGTSGQGGVDVPAYEVFPVTIHAGPDVAFALATGRTSESPEQIAEGAINGTIWTGFSPAQVTTDSSGTAHSNLTIAGAVMPFVPNPIASVSLPITATSANGLAATAGLPIEFLGAEGGLANLHTLNSPGPLLFSGTLQASTGNSLAYEYLIAYAPPAGSGNGPINVSLSIAGSWNNGKAGPLPTAVQVSLQQPTFQLRPGHVVYFWVDETNGLNSSDVTGANNYTLAVQENIGSSTYLEPLSLSITSGTLIGPLSITSNPPASNGPLHSDLSFVEGLVVVAAVALVVLGSVLFLKRRKAPRPAVTDATAVARALGAHDQFR